MPHHKSKCSSSSSSESCCEQKCDIEPCECITPEQLACMKSNAIVEVHAEYILLGTGITSATGGTPLADNVRADIILESNGFFIKGHYIVCPAHTVLMPPSLTSVANRYPFFDETDLALGQIKDQMIRASRILVSVFNVNNKKHAYVYEASLVGVDGAGDIAVLKIDYKKQWNQCNPCVAKCHPYLQFGCSRSLKKGEKAYLIGDFVSSQYNLRLFNGVGAISEGLVADHRYIDYAGKLFAESVLVSAEAYAFSAGMPILNCQGQVVAMQTSDLAAVHQDVAWSYGSGFVAGPSEYFMRRIIRKLIKKKCGSRTDCHIECIDDPAGAYYRYKKAYTGLAYHVFTGPDYDITADFTSGGLGGAEGPRPRIRLTSTGDFMSLPDCKELVGLKVVGVAGLNPTDSAVAIANGYIYVPGGTGAAPLPAFMTISPLLNRIQPGDVITHVCKKALGDLEKQVALSLITWRKCSGDRIEICYRRGGNALNTADNSATDNYNNLQSYEICLVDFPKLMDYPWYAVNFFPLLTGYGFTFPATQITSPQFPALAAGAPFAPAL